MLVEQGVYYDLSEALMEFARAWGYGKDGVLLGNTYVLVSGLAYSAKQTCACAAGARQASITKNTGERPRLEASIIGLPPEGRNRVANE